MSEPVPIIDCFGNIVGYATSISDFLRLTSLSLKRRYFVWIDKSKATELTKLVKDRRLCLENKCESLVNKKVEEFELRVYESFRLRTDLEALVDECSKTLQTYLKNKLIIVAYSGGKDSTAALILLDKLRDRIDFDIKALYVRIPYLDSETTLKFVEFVSRRLGIDLEVINVKKREIRSYLKWLGLPRRGLRWCTQFKSRPMRKYLKNLAKDYYLVVADRVYESYKRFWKLHAVVTDGKIIDGRKLKLISGLSLLDVIAICRRYGLIHPYYLEGLPRVSCVLCPYKSLYEFTCIDTLEDPGLIDEVIKKTFRKFYSDLGIKYDEFIEQELWRFPRKTALFLYRLRKALSKYYIEEYMISYDSMLNIVRRLWTQV